MNNRNNMNRNKHSERKVLIRGYWSICFITDKMLTPWPPRREVPPSLWRVPSPLAWWGFPLWRGDDLTGWGRHIVWHWWHWWWTLSDFWWIRHDLLCRRPQFLKCLDKCHVIVQPKTALGDPIRGGNATTRLLNASRWTTPSSTRIAPTSTAWAAYMSNLAESKECVDGILNSFLEQNNLDALQYVNCCDEAVNAL